MEDWIIVDPKEGGPGTTPVKISAVPNTGRNARNTLLQFTSKTDPNIKIEVPVTQEGLDEFVSFSGIKEIILSSNKTELLISGFTNSSKLTFTTANSDLRIELPESYIAGGEPTKNGTELKYDAGQHDTFCFRFFIHIPENNSSKCLQNKIIATANNGCTSELIITQLTE